MEVITLNFMTLAGLQNYILDRGWYIIMMSLSVQHSVVESLSFNGKNIRAVHVPSLGECLVGIDVSREIGMLMKIMAGGQLKNIYPKTI